MATEETKPVEREGFEEWVRDVESQRPDDHCSMRAAWDAALERAAQEADAHNEEHFAKSDAGVYRNCGTAIAMAIRALKGSR